MAYRLAFLAAVVAAWLATPSAANHHCVRAADRGVINGAERAVQCIRQQAKQSSNAAVLSASINVAAKRFAQKRAPDGDCRTAFVIEVADLRPIYDSAVTDAMQASGGDLDIGALNQLTEQCRVDSQVLGEIADYGVSSAPASFAITDNNKGNADSGGGDKADSGGGAVAANQCLTTEVQAELAKNNAAVRCVDSIMRNKGKSWSRHTIYSVAALAVNIDWHMAPKGCQDTFRTHVELLMATLDQAIDNAKAIDAIVDEPIVNRVIAQCEIGSGGSGDHLSSAVPGIELHRGHKRAKLAKAQTVLSHRLAEVTTCMGTDECRDVQRRLELARADVSRYAAELERIESNATRIEHTEKLKQALANLKRIGDTEKAKREGANDDAPKRTEQALRRP